MEYVYSIIKILAGCGVFLLGFKLLSDNMEKLAGNGLKRLFNKTSDKKFVGVGLGAAATAVVQSSAITTVMVIGFVNTGIMSLKQATAIIMGANIGTTITAQIVALQAFKLNVFFMIPVFVGMAMNMFSKKDKVRLAGIALAGLGLVFVGLNVMSEAMENELMHEALKNLLAKVSNPFLLLFVGVAFTALMQSSSAVTTIVITMATQGLIVGNGGNSVLFVILGSNIGSCVTALISSIGTSVNARRASVIHLLFNVIGTFIFMVVLLAFPSFQQNTFERWFSSPETQIAMFHTFFNVVCTCLFLPFTDLLVKLAMLIVPENKKEEEKEKKEDGVKFVYMDKRFLTSPALAISQLKKETFRMADMAMASLATAFNGFIHRDMSTVEKVAANNERIADLSKAISDYLVKVSAAGPSLDDEKKISAMHNNVGDIVRISELADNLTKYTKKTVNENLTFSPAVGTQLTEMYALLQEQYSLVKRVVLMKEYDLRDDSDKVEDRVDNMRRSLISDHIDRMQRGECNAENNPVFINLVANLERVGDHLNYVAHSVDGYVA
ncbi:MAG: Na/Pi cotransporter family protein [Clostridiales bacterium]|nr:Na/Pi cotransporter family protein [Clostridiales bacterium]MDY4895019.1 Na/Pi cotransporter family protein [Christensenellaceae bacterium]